MVRIPMAEGGEMGGYLAKPSGDRGPGVVVLQEIFGVSKSLRGVCDWLASEGFAALSPDLYWRFEPGADLDESQRDKARELSGKLDPLKVTDDIAAAMEFLRPQTTGRVGAVGFCLGGRLAFLTAARKKPAAAVGYYGVGIENVLGEAGGLSCPLMLHFGEKDNFTPPAVIEKIGGALGGDRRVTIHKYADCDHAFARKGGGTYKPEAAELANSRTLAFLRQHLK